MKRSYCKLVFPVFCLAVILLGGCETGPPPKLTFEKLGHDFGQIPPNKLTKARIKFTNTGEGVLRIKKVEDCCGVVARLAGGKKKYAPGESGTLEVEFTSAPKPGPYTRELIIHTNDRENRTSKFRMRAKIIMSITWEPESLQLFLDRENAGCPKVTLRCLKKTRFSITGFKSTGDCITADLDPSVKAAEFVLEPKVDMDKIGKNIQGDVTITVTHTDGNAVIIPFDVLPKYTVSPKEILLFDPTSGKPVVKEVSIVNNYGDEFEIESLVSKSGVVSVKVLEQKKTDKGYRLNVEMTFAGAQEKGLFVDEFTVKIKGDEDLAIPCKVWYLNKD